MNEDFLEILVDDELYKDIFDIWGSEAQFIMATEEAAEMIVALQHLKRDRVDMKEFIEECADTFFMMLQMRHLSPRWFDKILIQKYKRTKAKIEHKKKEISETIRKAGKGT